MQPDARSWWGPSLVEVPSAGTEAWYADYELRLRQSLSGQCSTRVAEALRSCIPCKLSLEDLCALGHVLFKES